MGFWPDAKALSPNVTGPLFWLVRNNAKMKSFHALVNCQINVTMNPGTDTGSTTLLYVEKVLAPSTRAASMISVGTAVA